MVRPSSPMNRNTNEIGQIKEEHSKLNLEHAQMKKERAGEEQMKLKY